MKSFKLISLQLVTEDIQLVEIPLTDGLIINKESGDNTWLLEAFVEEDHFKQFESSLPPIDGEATLQAVITKKDNEPALFKTKLKTVKQVGPHFDLLFLGQIQNIRTKYAELLLENLIQEGLNGEELIQEFKDKIRTRPKFAPTKSN